jgi:hypothetical protein
MQVSVLLQQCFEFEVPSTAHLYFSKIFLSKRSIERTEKQLEVLPLDLHLRKGLVVDHCDNSLTGTHH